MILIRYNEQTLKHEVVERDVEPQEAQRRINEDGTLIACDEKSLGRLT